MSDQPEVVNKAQKKKDEARVAAAKTKGDIGTCLFRCENEITSVLGYAKTADALIAVRTALKDIRELLDKHELFKP